VWCRRLAVLLDVTALSPASPENLEERRAYRNKAPDTAFCRF
jgi:hypothetical protein